MATMFALTHSDFVCKNYMLNVLDNILYGMYSSIKKYKYIIGSFETKSIRYEEVPTHIMLDKFLDFKMVDSRTKMS